MGDPNKRTPEDPKIENMNESNKNNPSQSNGTPCNLPGVIYHETESGMLVVNVTWKNKTFIGTLLDSTKYQWAPPRLTDGDSETDNRKNSRRKFTNTRSMIPGTTQSSQKRTTRRSKLARDTALELETTKNTRGYKKKNKTKKEKEAERELKAREAEEEKRRLEEEAKKSLYEEMKDSSDEAENVAKKVSRNGKKVSNRSNTPTKNNDEDYNPKGSSKRYKPKEEENLKKRKGA